MIINIRGTNGSGKTTLARQLIGPNPAPVDLIVYDSPTKRNPNRKAFVEGWGNENFLAIGSYKQGCGGMDTVPSFDLQQKAVLAASRWERDRKPFPGPAPRHVVCEGVLASTVAGSWLDFFIGCQGLGHRVLIAYLDTPLELCLDRIRARQIAAKGEAREIKKDLVENKIKSINATRDKFRAAGIDTVTLRHETALTDLMGVIEFMTGEPK